LKKTVIWTVAGPLCALLFLAGTLYARNTAPAGGQKKATAHASGSKSKKAASKSHRSSQTKKASRRRRGNWRRHGQQAIKEDRAREIQAALIREHYLTGEPSGVWDARTKQAMTKYQQDHGWQTRKLPDARALIELGLGPNHDGLLNPESVASTQRPGGAPPADPAVTAPHQP
jgi:hypothetical protein